MTLEDPPFEISPHRPHGRFDLPRQRAAVGVAQDDRFGAGHVGRAQRRQRVGRVGLVAVEEVLGVVEDLAAVRPKVGYALADHRQVLVQGRLHHAQDVKIPGLAENRDDRRLGVEQHADLRIGFAGHSGLAGGAECGDPRLL